MLINDNDLEENTDITLRSLTCDLEHFTAFNFTFFSSIRKSNNGASVKNDISSIYQSV